MYVGGGDASELDYLSESRTAIPITIVSAANCQAGAENIDFYNFRIYYMNKNPNITTTT